MSARDRLRIAVQKSGRLSEASIALLAQCGLSFRQSRDKLFCYGETLAVDLLLVRDDDIPGLIAEGVCDMGIVGRNVFEEQGLGLSDNAGAGLREWRALGFGACRLSIAVPQDFEWQSAQSLAGSRIATSYPNLLGRYLRANGIHASVVMLNGSVEIAPRLGTADLICDLVSTGGTLAANQLREVDTVMLTEAVLVGAERDFADARGELRDLLLRRMDGVLAVKDARMLLLTAPRAALAAIRAALPNSAVPTVLGHDANPDEVSVQTLCLGAVNWQLLEDLKRAGAHSLMVLPVERMLT